MIISLLHLTLGLTANRKPPLFPILPAVPGEFSLTAGQVEYFTTKSTEACLELVELGGIKINFIISGLIIVIFENIANQVCI